MLKLKNLLMAEKILELILFMSNMENRKQSRTSEDRDGVDMISKLPDPILHLILSRLQSTEEVIRTSILSSRWRHLWTSVPSIDIDYSRRLNPNEEFEKNKFEHFVSHVLSTNTLDLDTFRLHCTNYYNMSTIKQWIHVAITRKVKLIDLMFCPKDQLDYIEVPDCNSLRVLRLFLLGHAIRVPKLQGFSVLRVLELNSVQIFDGDLVTDLLKRCPLLKDLKLKNLVFSSHIQISCPKLAFLELTGYIGHFKYILKNLDKLKKAVINPNVSVSVSAYELMGHNNLRELFVGISRVKFLSINPLIILKSIDAVSLPNLKTLELRTSIDNFPMDDVIKIVKHYPHLEALHLIIQDVVSYQRSNSFQFAYEKLDEVETMRILTRHLKRIEFLEFSGQNPSLNLARLLLLYGDALEEMVFSWGDKEKYPRKSTETMKKMSKFCKASSIVKVATLLRE
ncbi:hypothetical protein LXL04_026954 [Taraxacum kok-saghyz]